MEFCERSTLKDYIETVDRSQHAKQIKEIFSQIVSGL
jgi:hypothetical protein